MLIAARLRERAYAKNARDVRTLYYWVALNIPNFEFQELNRLWWGFVFLFGCRFSGIKLSNNRESTIQDSNSLVF